MTEKEYIEREALVERLKKEECDCEWLWTILDVPAADVAPVRHGEWCGTVCSACGESTSFYYDCYYCPWCGAKMDGENNG